MFALTPTCRGLVLACLLAGIGSAAQAGSFAPECAAREVKAITLIEDLGQTPDMSSDRLATAGLKMLDAREACYAGRVDEALATYHGILTLRPVLADRTK